MISTPMTVVAIMNGMIGGTILVLPLLFMTAGIIPSIISLIIMGLVNYVSCIFCVDHLANDNDLPDTLNRHSNGNMIFGNIYNIVVFCGNTSVCIMYFYLICIQLELIFNSLSNWIPIINALVLLVLIIILKKFNFGTRLLGYGIISIISYLIFLLWVFFSRPPSSSENNIPIWTWNFNEVFNALSTAYAIQGVFIPIIRKCKKQQNYSKIILWSFILGGLAYSYIGFTGSFGIIDRIPYIKNPQTIEEYFSNEDWPVLVIAIVYLVHLYTALPQYLSIGVSRFLSLCKIESSHTSFAWQQIVFILISLAICTVTSILNIQLSLILAINGSIIGFFMTYLVPVYIIFRCYYFVPQQAHQLVQINVETKEQIDSANSVQKQVNIQTQSKDIISQSSIESTSSFSNCVKTTNPCKIKIIMLINLFMIGFGLFVLVYTLYTLAAD